MLKPKKKNKKTGKQENKLSKIKSKLKILQNGHKNVLRTDFWNKKIVNFKNIDQKIDQQLILVVH